MNEFDERHDFDSEELKILSERHPSVKFYHIPEAWILPIDEMLCSVRYTIPFNEVRQINGMLVVAIKHGVSGPELAKYKEIISVADYKIYNIDRDLNQIKDERVPQCPN
jgi:hypothetical protein